MYYPVVSVIVPIYNVENYLQKCIDSVCVQTYSHIEIILIDDGSSDNSGIICDKYLSFDSRIVVVHKKNGGLSSARNAGLDIAKGEYIAFVDADDRIHPKFIESLIKLSIQYNADISQCDYLSIMENSFELPLNPLQSIYIYNNRQAIYELCCTNNSNKYVVVWNKLYKKKLFDNIRFPVGKIHEDEFVIHLLLWKADRIVITNQYLYYYLQRKTSIVNKSFSLRRLDAIDAFKERLLFLKSHKFEDEYLATLQSLVFLLDKYYRLTKEYIKDCDKVCINLIREKETAERLYEKEVLLNRQIERSCRQIKDSRIVLYGAGYWGRIFYKWIDENNYAVIVGWVDTRWSKIQNISYSVDPIDMLLKYEYDYILVTIKNKLLQQEIVKNLVSWGIHKDKIELII